MKYILFRYTFNGEDFFTTHDVVYEQVVDDQYIVIGSHHTGSSWNFLRINNKFICSTINKEDLLKVVTSHKRNFYNTMEELLADNIDLFL
jgi:hypothetical protein